MHKHTISFKDFNDQAQTVDLYFNLSEAELTKMQIQSEFGLQKDLEQALKNEDNKKLLEFMEYLVHHAYGIKSADGMVFDKSDEIMNRFEHSAYYSDLYMSLFAEEGQVGVRFINSIMPAELIRRAEANARGEGELAAAAAAVKPDSRTIFEQSRAELRDRQPKKDEENTVKWQESSIDDAVSQRYVPQNQPSLPTATSPAISPAEDADYQAYLAQKNSAGRTDEAPAVQQGLGTPAEAPAGVEGFIARPPHESGAGFEVNREG